MKQGLVVSRKFLDKVEDKKTIQILLCPFNIFSIKYNTLIKMSLKIYLLKVFVSKYVFFLLGNYNEIMYLNVYK